MSKQSRMSEFRLRGQFLGFVAPDAKRIRLATPTGEFTVKLPKELRPGLNHALTLGDWLEVIGSQMQALESGKLKLKAERVLTLSQSQHQSQPAVATPSELVSIQAIPTAQSKSYRKAEILVCQKSDCCKLGGNALIRELQAELNQRGLTDIQLKGTGCMKRCKAGPNLIMPDKSRYSRIQADDVAALLDQHFSAAEELAS